MKATRVYYGILGILLVVVGAIILLQINGVIASFEGALWQTIWPAVFAIGGLGFLVAFLTSVHDRWSAIIPAIVLLAIAGLGFFGDQLGPLSGGLFLGAIGLSFLLVFLARREAWWALIPAGALLTLGVVAGTSALPGSSGELGGAIMFFGFALTFLAIYFAPSPTGRRKWALIPAAASATLAVLVFVTTSDWWESAETWWLYIGPLLLIVGGAFILYGAFRKGRTPNPKS